MQLTKAEQSKLVTATKTITALTAKASKPEPVKKKPVPATGTKKAAQVKPKAAPNKK